MRPISIFTLTFGRWEYTKLFLKYLIQGLGQAREAVEEIVIYDTLPYPWNQDETQDRLREIQQQGFLSWPPEKFRIMFHDQDYGPSILFNRALLSCNKERDIFFTGNDVFYGDNWLQPLRACAYAPHHEKMVSWIAPYIAPEICLDEQLNVDFRNRYFNQEYSTLIQLKNADQIDAWLNHFYEGNFLDFAKIFVARNQGKVYDQMHGSCALIKREAIEQVGGWDEQFSYRPNGQLGARGSDDIDMWIRLTNANLFTITCFDSFAHHVICCTSRQRDEENTHCYLTADGTLGSTQIENGNRLIQKWEQSGEELLYPFEVAGKKVPHPKFKLRTVPLAGDMQKVDLGLPGQIGLPYMINWNRTDAFPL